MARLIRADVVLPAEVVDARARAAQILAGAEAAVDPVAAGDLLQLSHQSPSSSSGASAPP